MVVGWMEEIEAEVLGHVRERGGLSARQLAARLRVSESLAVSCVCLLASKGLVTIERIALPREIRQGPGDAAPVGSGMGRPDRTGGGADPVGAAIYPAAGARP
jgi:hypothetical protein